MSSERNKEIVRRWQVAYNAGNLDALDELLAPDWVTNSWPQDQPQTIENAKAIHRMMPGVLPGCPFHNRRAHRGTGPGRAAICHSGHARG